VPSLTTVRAVCPHDCPDTCGMLATVDRDAGRVLSVRGDPDHPFTRGFLCQKVARYQDRVHHPDRLTHPLRRVGRKGEGRFERTTWDEAAREIAARFREIAASPDGPQAILPYSYSGTLGKVQGSSLDRRFFHRLGASLLDRTICATAGAAGCDVTLGTRAVIDPEAAIHSRLIVNWGSNTSVTNPHFWAVVVQARKLGAKVVTIDPHRSKTAARSDQWVAIRPGTDAALALGVMHVLFRDGLQDQDYLDRYCLGGDGLKARVLAEYSPAVVSRITGLSVDEIETFAREYGTARDTFGGPALIRLNYGLQRHGGGGMAARTVSCLPAVTGDWRYPGGGALLSTSKLFPFAGAALERPDLIPPGTRTVNMVQLAEALAGELPGPPVKALYVYCANPAAVNPHQGKVHRGLARDDLFTVVHEQFQTDTADYADIVLPATTQLEQWDVHNGYGQLYVQVNEPAIPPLGEAKPNTEVFRLLARAMGFEPELFEVSDQDLIRTAITAAGGPVYPPREAFDGLTLERLVADGAVRLNLPRNYAPFAEGRFGTPSGKCELFSPREADSGRDPLPHYVPPHEDPQTKPELAAKYPLQMVCPPEPSFLNSTFANLAGHLAAAGSPRVELHPADAAARGIADGDQVYVFNGRGRFRATAAVGETVRPGVAATFGTRWGRDVPGGANCNATTGTALTDLGGGATFFDNLVEVERASNPDQPA
jgi:anaerobic selenocysteine-containing dehydrogenase